MDTLDRLSGLVWPAATLWFIALTALRTTVVFRRGYRVELGLARGNPRRGILYSLTFSLLPWKKESTRRHPWAYAAGMGLHVGVLTALVFALGRRFGFWPREATWLLGGLMLLGIACAAGLFLHRCTASRMRPISTLDDYVSNVLVQLFLVGGALTAFAPSAAPLWRASAILLLFYAPLGKIYHMVLFFVSRTLFGLQFGRRGVLRHDAPLTY